MSAAAEEIVLRGKIMFRIARPLGGYWIDIPRHQNPFASLETSIKESRDLPNRIELLRL
jgi:hypothetical protein